jgi:hypothetical protein
MGKKRAPGAGPRSPQLAIRSAASSQDMDGRRVSGWMAFGMPDGESAILVLVQQ